MSLIGKLFKRFKKKNVPLEQRTGKFFQKLRKKKKKSAFDKVGTMSQPFTDDFGQPINPDYPKKTKTKTKNITSRKYDIIANKKFKRDYDDLGPIKKRAVRRRARKMKMRRKKKRGIF